MEKGKADPKKGPSSAKGKEVFTQIDKYLHGALDKLDFDIDWSAVQATPFQKKLWKKMEKIGFGKTKTYGQLAESLGKPGAARAVGSGCNRNPLLLRIPCHRVVAQNDLGGFALGTDMKMRLLELEGLSFEK